MSTLPALISDALKEAGASEENARAAAAGLTDRDDRFAALDQRLRRAEQRLDHLAGRLGLVEQALELADPTNREDLTVLERAGAELSTQIGSHGH